MSELQRHRFRLPQTQQPFQQLQSESGPGRIYFLYANDWTERSRRIRKHMPRCTRNIMHRASCVHHLYYQISVPRALVLAILFRIRHGHWHYSTSVASREIAGWDVIPLCDACHGGGPGRSKHSTVHQRGKNPAWIEHDSSDQNFDSQRPDLLWKLRRQYWTNLLLWKLRHLLWVGAIAVMGISAGCGYLAGVQGKNCNAGVDIKRVSASVKSGSTRVKNQQLSKTLLRRNLAAQRH